jgi:hypothetical protein
MPPGGKWSNEEKLRLLACIDHCQQNDLEFNEFIPKMLAHQGVERTWRAICHTLKSLANNVSGSLASFKEHGSRFAVISKADRAQVSALLPEAATSAAILNRNAAASSSRTVSDPDSNYAASERSVTRDESAKVCVFGDMGRSMSDH